MIVLKSPKGWTGPKEVDGLPVHGFQTTNSSKASIIQALQIAADRGGR